MALDERVVVVDAVQAELDDDVGEGRSALQRLAIEGVALHELHALGDAERLGVRGARPRARRGRCRPGWRGRGAGGSAPRAGTAPARRRGRRPPAPACGSARSASNTACSASARMSRKATARAPAQQPAVDRAPTAVRPEGSVGVDMGHEGTRVEAVAVADAQPVAQQRRPHASTRAARRSATRAARSGQLALQLGEARSAASAGMRVARGLDELAEPVELMRLGGPAARRVAPPASGARRGRMSARTSAVTSSIARGPPAAAAR